MTKENGFDGLTAQAALAGSPYRLFEHDDRTGCFSGRSQETAGHK
jgi:hypothetical protein